MINFYIKKLVKGEEVYLDKNDSKYFGTCLNYPLGLYYASDNGTQTLVDFHARFTKHGFYTANNDDTLGYTNGEVWFLIYEHNSDLIDLSVDNPKRISSIWDFAYKHRFKSSYNRTYLQNN